MIWGRTKAERDSYRKGHRWFAWRPVRLEDGRWAWMNTVWREAEECTVACGRGVFGSVRAWRWTHTAISDERHWTCHHCGRVNLETSRWVHRCECGYFITPCPPGSN